MRNLQADPRVMLRMGDETRTAHARVVTDAGEQAVARPLLAAKYQGWQAGRPLSNWASSATVVALEPPV